MTAIPPTEQAKRAAAARALRLVEPGMVLGLGTGSTAAWAVSLLADRIRDEGLAVTCVPTSSRTRDQAQRLGIPLTTLDEVGRIDLTLDGADEFDPRLRLVKGGGGALLQEKIVAASSTAMVVMADAGKEVAALGAFPLPVEIVRFGAASTARRIAAVLADQDVARRDIALRPGPYVTDEGHYLLDLSLGHIAAPETLDRALRAIPGVVETGLFLGLCALVIVGLPDGSARLVTPPRGEDA